MPSSAKYIDTTTIMARGNDKGCPRCGGEVFHAEQMFSKEKKYHKVLNVRMELHYIVFITQLSGGLNYCQFDDFKFRIFRNASVAKHVLDLWIQCWLVMDLIMTYIARVVTRKSLVLMDTGLEEVLHFFRRLICKL